MKGVTSGVHFLCSHHIQHRDIKPANILVNLEGDVKVSTIANKLTYLVILLTLSIINNMYVRYAWEGI